VNGGIHRFYQPLLHASLARPWAALAILAAISALTVPLLGAIGSSLFPPAETPQFLVRVQTPDGTSMAKTDQAVRFVERTLSATPEIRWHAGNTGRGNPQIFYNQAQRETQANFGEVYASLRLGSRAERAVLDGLRARFDATRRGDQRGRVRERPAGERPIEVRVTGERLDVPEGAAGGSRRRSRRRPGRGTCSTRCGSTAPT
jgi:multidrug efflux pump subunit AcrB